MSKEAFYDDDADAGESLDTERTREDLAAELELVREHNRRLRDAVVTARRTQYRRSAYGLGAIGLVAVAGAALFPGVRDVLLVLGATGLFGAVLTYYLTPERFVAASVGSAVYEALADDREATVGELGLGSARVYVPIGSEHSRVRLYVPQSDDYALPADDDLDATYVVPDDGDRGVAFRPTGEALFHPFEDALSGGLGETPAALARQLPDALVEQFGLVDSTQVDLDATHGRLTVGVGESVYGRVDRIDHPVASFLAVGLARGLGRPVTVEARPAEGDRVDFHVTCRWETDATSDE